ncbi:MAG: RNA polymerase sigma factor [Cytophagales bacterium]
MTDQEILDKFYEPTSRNWAFHVLVKQYQKKVYYHIRRMVVDHDDADDLVQETFIKIWKGLDNFQGQSALYTWIYRIATNESLNFLAKKRRRFFLPIGDVEGELKNKIDNSSPLDGDEIQKHFQKALLTLPEKQRLVFNMKYFDEMKYEEISEVLGTSVGALKASYHHATKKIEEYVNKL